MARFRVYGLVHGSKFLGEVEANSKEEAEEKGWKLDGTYVGLCHQCASQIDDAEIHTLQLEEVKPGE